VAGWVNSERYSSLTAASAPLNPAPSVPELSTYNLYVSENRDPLPLYLFRRILLTITAIRVFFSLVINGYEKKVYKKAFGGVWTFRTLLILKSLV
jgi:hypothetical protein